MKWPLDDKTLYGIILLVLVALPLMAPTYHIQMAYLGVMILLSMTWDVQGGQAGYNSFGNIFFFGIGMYTTAVVQRSMFFDFDEYEKTAGSLDAISSSDYVISLGVGFGASGILCVLVALVIGSAVLGLRGHYFAICTLGLAIGAGEIAGGIDYIGAGSGMVTPVFPDGLGSKGQFFYIIFMVLATVCHFTLKWLYGGRFGLALNAIRDDEDKAEAMGLHTTRYKVMGWMLSAFFLGITGGAMGNLIGFIDPVDTAFAGATFGVWMVLMAILGGKGTIWGPVIGAIIFHVAQELLWAHLFGWQRVALGAMIVGIVVFFPQGIMGYIRAQWPHLLGHKVDEAMTIEDSKGGTT
jgi:branched-chain amino acid transport system permease protein